MDNSEYTAFSSFKDVGVSGAETFNAWRKKTNGIIVHLDELNIDFDDSTIGLNPSNLLFVKDQGITPAKLSTGAPVWDVDGNLSASAFVGNATTATTLAASKTINGTAFDGSANITITANTPNSLTAGSHLIATGVFDGSAARTFSVEATTAATASKIALRGTDGTLIAASPTAATHVATKAYVDAMAEDANTIIGLSLFIR